MNETSNPFESVFREVTEYFADIPHITVIPGEGTAPEQYTVTFQIPGVSREDDHTVTPSGHHVVSLTLPANFPHLPPICFPETSIFHPDVTSTTMNIGEAWRATHSIVQLILHIAKMISGEAYSTTGAINQEALEWYQAHSDDLPFDGSWAALNPEESSASMDANGDLYGIDMASDDDFKIDIADDDDFADAFSLDQGTPQEDAMDTELLNIMARQKRFQALSEVLKKTDEQFHGRAEMEEKIRSSLNRGMELFQEASDLEHQGQLQKALEKLQAIGELVSDYPLLLKAKKRVQQAVDLLGDWVETEEISDTQAPKGAGAVSSTSADQARKDSFAAYQKAERNKRLFTILGVSVLTLAVLALSFYFFFNSRLKKAESHYAECQSLLQDDSFADAESKCNQALTLTDKVKFFRQARKRELSAEIRSLLDSPKLQQGLAGKTLLDGKYVSHAQKELIMAFRAAKSRGDSLFSNKQWQEASLNYERALNHAKEAKLNEADGMSGLHEKAARAKIYLAIEKGKNAFSSSQWDEAISQYKKAIRLIEKNSTLLGKNYVEQTSGKLATILLYATIIRDRQHVDQQLQMDEYGPALKELRNIEKYIRASEFADQEQFQAILSELDGQISGVQKDALIFTQETYLEDNYEELFLKHYPSARHSELSTPRVSFLKEVGSKLLFRMQCTEKVNGRSLRLQMDYLYSPARGTWRFYGGK